MKKNKPMIRSENMARVKSKNTKPEIFQGNFYGIGDSDTELIIRSYLEALIFIFLNIMLPYL